MKLILSCTVVLIVIFAGVSSQAQVTLTLYDNFQSKYLNPDNWFGSESGTTVLESVRQIKTDPVYGYKSLSLLHRGYGGTGSNSGRTVARNRLLFSDGTGISTIQAKVQVKKVQAVGCTANITNPNTDVQARFGGFFFNTGTPTPGDSTNDVGAFVALRRLSESDDKPNVLEVVGYAIHCTNADCTQSTPIGDTGQDLGTALVGQRIKLRITWDQVNNRFVFQKGNSSEVPLAYDPGTYPDGADPGTSNGGFKRLDVQELVTNCTSLPRPVGFMEVWFDDVFTN